MKGKKKKSTKLTFKNQTELKHEIKQMKLQTFVKWKRDAVPHLPSLDILRTLHAFGPAL